MTPCQFRLLHFSQVRMRSIRVVNLDKFVWLVNERENDYQKSGSPISISCCFLISKLLLFVGLHMPPPGNHHHLHQNSLGDVALPATLSPLDTHLSPLLTGHRRPAFSFPCLLDATDSFIRDDLSLIFL